MYEARVSHIPESYVKRMDTNRESLFFVLDQYFSPKVICADSGRSCLRIRDTIRFLKRNLEQEERLMELSGYSGLATHKRDHMTALETLEKLNATLMCNHYDNDVVAGFIEDWADKHALAFDKPFTDFLRLCPKKFQNAPEEQHRTGP